ncbi:phosphotransferase family protein [Streptomyces sp. NPDC002523]
MQHRLVPGGFIGDLEVLCVRHPVDSFHGGTYVVATEIGRILVKYRPERRPLAVTRSVTHLLHRRGVAVQEVVIPLTSTDEGWMLGLRWIEGRPLSPTGLRELPSAQRRQLGEQLADWLSVLHTIRVPGGSWSDKAEHRFRRKMDQALAAGVIGVAEERLIRSRWAGLAPSLGGVVPSLIHRDLHQANILVAEGRLATVIDLENSRTADPLYDLVKLKDHVLTLDPHLADGFRDRYGTRTWSAEQRDRFAAACLLEYLSAVVYHARRQETDTVRDRLRSLLALCLTGTDALGP